MAASFPAPSPSMSRHAANPEEDPMEDFDSPPASTISGSNQPEVRALLGTQISRTLPHLTPGGFQTLRTWLGVAVTFVLDLGNSGITIPPGETFVAIYFDLVHAGLQIWLHPLVVDLLRALFCFLECCRCSSRTGPLSRMLKSIHNQVEQPIDLMYSSSHRPRQCYHLSPADKMTLPPPASIECGNQPIDIMYSSSHLIWYYLYRAKNMTRQPEGSIECGNQVEKPIDIMNSSSHHLSPAENKGSIECGNQVEQPIDIMNSSSHHLSPAENKGSIRNQVEPSDLMYFSVDPKGQQISLVKNTTPGSIHNQSEKPINLAFSPSCGQWYRLTPDKQIIPPRPLHLCPRGKFPWTFECGNRVEEQIDIMKTEKPERYKEIVHVCKFALNHYKDSHPEKPCYEFESVEKSFARAVAGKAYSLTFKARNVEDGKLAVFEAHAHQLFGKELEMSKIELLLE